MLCLTLKDQTVDLTWPDGRHLVLVGPTVAEPRIRVASPDFKAVQYYPAPNRRGEYIRIVWGDKTIGLLGRPHSAARSRCSVKIDVEPAVVVRRRSWQGRRHAL